MEAWQENLAERQQLLRLAGKSSTCSYLNLVLIGMGRGKILYCPAVLQDMSPLWGGTFSTARQCTDGVKIGKLQIMKKQILVVSSVCFPV